MIITVLNKEEARIYKPKNKAIWISIQDLDKEHTINENENNYISILKLKFDDINFKNDLTNEISATTKATKEDIKEIKKFLKENHNVDEIVINCFYGKSRSVAISKYILESIKGNVIINYREQVSQPLKEYNKEEYLSLIRTRYNKHIYFLLTGIRKSIIKDIEIKLKDIEIKDNKDNTLGFVLLNSIDEIEIIIYQENSIEEIEINNIVKYGLYEIKIVKEKYMFFKEEQVYNMNDIEVIESKNKYINNIFKYRELNNKYNQERKYIFVV